MNAKACAALAACMSCCCAPAARAIDYDSIVEISAQIPGTANVRSSITVFGSNSLLPYVLAGGYTLQCALANTLPIAEQAPRSFPPTGLSGRIDAFTVPERATQPAPLQPKSVVHTIAGFGGLAPGTCTLCNLQHTSIASNALGAALSGLGASITLSGASSLPRIQTAQFELCKPSALPRPTPGPGCIP